MEEEGKRRDSRKVGLAICYDYHDYGSMLQAYATYKKISNLGYECEAININPLKEDIKKRKIKYFVRNIFDWSIVKEKSAIINKKIRGKIDRNLKENLEKRDRAFDSFCNTHFRVSRPYSSWAELHNSCQEYQAVLVGSDQLWLPSNIAADYYTLSFVPDRTKKIAYATSFGVSDVSQSQKTKAASFLKRFQFLSAREVSGQKIIRSLTQIEAPLVCDPAILLRADDWDQVATHKRLINDKYIFCYLMGNNPDQRLFVKKLKAQTGCKVVALLHLDQYIKSDEEYVDEAPYDISPADFLSLIRNADFVCTDSFHGTVFSLIYGRPFFTFKRFQESATLSTNTRIDSLLQRLKVEDRLVQAGSEPETYLNLPLDFDAIHRRLETFRCESVNYLIHALEQQEAAND